MPLRSRGDVRWKTYAKAQDDFIYDQNSMWWSRINAFGMELTSRMQWYVIHHGIFRVHEAYYQEYARVVMVCHLKRFCYKVCRADLQTQRFFIDNSAIIKRQNIKIWQWVKLQEMANYGATQMCLHVILPVICGRYADCGSLLKLLDMRGSSISRLDAQKVLITLSARWSHAVVRTALVRWFHAAETLLRGKVPW